MKLISKRIMGILLLFFLPLCVFSDQLGDAHTVITSGNDRRLPDISYNENSGKYLVVWEEFTGSYWNIKGRILNEDGSYSSSSIIINSASEAMSNPKVAHSNSDYWVVVWAQHGSIIGEGIVACRVTSSGTIYNKRNIKVNTLNALDFPDIGGSSQNNHFFIVWEEATIGVSIVKGVRYDAVTGVVGDEYTIGSALVNGAKKPSINQRGINFFVAWERHHSATRIDIEGRYVPANITSSSDLGDVIVVKENAGKNTEVSVATYAEAGPPYNFMLVWNFEYSANDYDVRFAHIQDGSYVSNSGDIVASGLLEYKPSVTHTKDNYYFVTYATASDWAGSFTIMGREKSSIGSTAGTEYSLGAGGSPEGTTIGGDSGKAVVVWDGNGGSTITCRDYYRVAPSTRIIALSGDLAFGNVSIGQSSQRTMTIANNGNSALTVNSISYPSGFSGNWSSGAIAAGDTQNVTVTFSPSTAQSYGGTVTVNSDKTSGTNTISCSGQGVTVPTRIIRITGDLAFGNVTVGQSSLRSMIIYNDGNSTLTVSSISYPSGFSGDWSGGSISAGNSRSVIVTFTPGAAQAYGGMVTVSSDKTSGTNTISCSGQGVPVASRIIRITGDLAFGDVTVGQSTQRSMTIYNDGNSMLTVSSIGYPSGFSGDWSGGIAPGGSQSVAVTFSPASAQSYSGTVTISSDKTSGTNTVPCSGQGVTTSTRIIGISGNLTFGSVPTGQNAQRAMTISNTGNSALTVYSIGYPSGFSGDWSSGTIASGVSQVVTVTFSPTTNQSYGGTITVDSDKTSGSNTISCSGQGTSTSNSIPFSESFSASTLPMGWTTQNEGVAERWTISVTGNAGGAPNEMRCEYGYPDPAMGTTRLVTPPLNTAGYSSLHLSFKHMLDDFGPGATLKIQTSTDGSTWTDEAWSLATASNSNVGPATVSTAIAHNLNSGTTYVAFVVTGNLYYIDYWYIDDVSLTSSAPDPVNYEDLFIFHGHDFNGDGGSDVGVFRPSNNYWYIRGTGNYVWGASGDKPVNGDYDNDSRTDIAVWRPASGNWIIRPWSGPLVNVIWGGSGDVPVPGDYDGDGKTDAAVWRPATGKWMVKGSAGVNISINWGVDGDIPVPGNYDGDGKTDLAIYRPATDKWYIRRSTNGTSFSYTWGASADVTVPGDYDGDGLTDVAVFRAAEGRWIIRRSSTGTTLSYTWGQGGDIPTPGDFDKDGKDDVAVFRPGVGKWIIRNSSTGSTVTYTWGTSGDVALVK